MSNDLEQATRSLGTRPPGVRPILLAACALALASLPGWAAQAPATPSRAAEAGRLHSALARMTRLTDRRLRPPALRLARDLPGDAERLERLTEPASAAQAQVKVALDELLQMNALVLDPHYPAALVATGRAYVAISGQDPLTGTTIDPEYLGLEPELAGDAARLRLRAGDAGELSAGVKLLEGALIHYKARAHRLELEVRRLRGGGSPPG